MAHENIRSACGVLMAYLEASETGRWDGYEAVLAGYLDDVGAEQLTSALAALCENLLQRCADLGSTFAAERERLVRSTVI